MGKINSANPPQYVPDTQLAAKAKISNDPTGFPLALEPTAPQDDLQLTKLSGVLNSFKKGAAAMRSQVAQVMASVRGGTYKVDPMQVSRSIVGESLASR
jgi:anti-sigma28 factor (negative regulator of flagellin synthesis)